jgi:gliding motility-associated-like protein
VLKTLFALFCCFVLSVTSTHAQVCTSEVYAKDINVGAPRAQFLLVLPGGGTIFGGRSFGSSSQINIVKTTPGGNIVLNKRVDGFPVSNLTTACLTPDKKILVGSGANLVLLDTNGVIQKAAATAMPWGGHYVHEVKTDSQGNIYALFEASGGGNRQLLLTKISPDLSTVLWKTTFGDLYTAIYRSVMVDGDKIFVVGSFPFDYGGDLDGSVLCFSALDGSLTRQVTITLDGYTCTFRNIHKTNDGYLLQGFYKPSGTPNLIQNHVIVRLNDTLRPVKGVRITDVLNTSPLYIEPDDHGGFYAGTSSAWLRFFHCNRQDSVTSSTIVFTSGIELGRFAASPTNLYAIDQSSWSIVKADLNGRTGGCNESVVSMRTVPLIPATVNKSLTPTNGFLSISGANHSVADAMFAITRECKAISACSTLKITGPPGICSNGTPVLFKGRRNTGCRLPVQWKINGSPADISQHNDSTISIQFLSSGHYQLIATLPTSCDVITDTLEIDVTLSSQLALNLGPDRDLCENNTVLLNARKGYSSYSWQDGSTDSTYIVTQPGTYHVTVTDACGGVFKDTVVVSTAPPIPFDVGPDRSKCNQDTLRFTAPAGFLNYSWSPAYNISSTTQPAVVVNPRIDTTYYVRGEKTPGCFAYDTIRVQVYTSPTIDLGSDASFCSGDSITLNAGSGFSSYTWNGVSGGQMKTVYTAGQFSVMGTTAEGCKSYDTIRVLNVWALPRVGLDKSPELCFGTTRTLSVGSFTSYLWQDGSTNPSFTIGDVGRYWVRVMDNNGCTGSDTMELTTILPLPRDFLPNDTAICSYGTISFKTRQTYRDYLWSTNSRSSSITIDKSGQYWLEVIDQDGCKGRDTIIVSPSQCMTGVYIPTAFSPNRDGRNEYFKAMVFGMVKKFELIVYNRWGEVIFLTTDPTRGWDGKIAGLEQATGVFVWTCRYLLEGGKESNEKGTVTLIR